MGEDVGCSVVGAVGIPVGIDVGKVGAPVGEEVIGGTPKTT